MSEEKCSWTKEYFMAILASLIISLTFTMYYIVIFLKLEGTNRDIAFTVVGSVTTLSAGVVNYYFGSSQGSADKSKHIESIMSKQVDSVNGGDK